MASRPPRVYLFRHGETEWSLLGQRTGKTDLPLTRKGEQVMARIAKKVVPAIVDPLHVCNVFVSPRKRALQTAEILLRNAQKSPLLAMEIDEDVAEFDYGAFEGLTTQQILERNPDWDMWRDGCPPGTEYPGESPEQMMERVDRVVAKVRAVQKKDPEDRQPAESGRDVIIVAHGDFSRAFVARWLNLPLDSCKSFELDPGAAMVLSYLDDTLETPNLVGSNWFVWELMMLVS